MSRLSTSHFLLPTSKSNVAALCAITLCAVSKLKNSHLRLFPILWNICYHLKQVKFHHKNEFI